MLTVINYHYIRENYNTKYQSIFGVTPNDFKKQLLLLKKEGSFISPKNLLDNADDVLVSKENNLLITFDDGLKEQFDFALPILEELNLKAIFFVNSMNFEEKKLSNVHKIHLLRSIISSEDFLMKINNQESIKLSNEEINKAKRTYIYDDEQSAFLKYLLNFKLTLNQQKYLIGKIFDNYFSEEEVLGNLYMTEENIKNIAKEECLGSHTHSHYPLGILQIDKIKFELSNSKKYLEKITNSNISIVSYPYGNEEACTDLVAELAHKEGYELGFTTKRGSNGFKENKLLLNRFDCNDLIGGKKLQIKYDY